MTVAPVRPTTLVGIKRYANQIKKSEGLPHMVALDRAAQAANFQNFRHAQRTLPTDPALQQEARHRLYLTSYWRDRQTGVRGRETLHVDLDSDWMRLIKPAKLGDARALAVFRPIAPDHLQATVQAESQSHARRRICAAVRTLRFIEATGLQPSRGNGRVFTGGVSIHELPGRDHGSVWYDPQTKRYLFANEPYEAAARSDAETRDAWAQSNRINVARPRWAGMYNPDGDSQLYLFSQVGRGLPLDEVVARLDRLPAPMVEAQWDGTSADVMPPFFSPRHGELIKPKPAAADGASRRGRRMHWGRKLLVLGLNHLLDRGLLSLDGTGGERGHCEAVIAGRPSMILWSDAGFQELRLSVWWSYDHSRHPQANLQGNSREEFQTSQPLAKSHRYREFVGATVSAWVERERGKYLQGRAATHLFDLYLRQDSKGVLEDIDDPVPKGFATEGKFMM